MSGTRALAALAARSAWNRRGTLALVVLSIALATALLLGLERLRQDVRSSFRQAVSGTDLIVGPRGGSVALLLEAVFHIGSLPGGVKPESVEAIAQHRAVAWTVPLLLGDSHRGRPVLGTPPAYFERFAYGDRQPLRFAEGRAHAGTREALYEAVIGAEVAHSLGYRLGQRVVLRHGLAGEGPEDHDHDDDHDHAPAASGDAAGGGAARAGAAAPRDAAGAPTLVRRHDDQPFTVVGILAPTGTPVDRTVHVSPEAVTALHLGWVGGAPLPAAAGLQFTPEVVRKFDLTPPRYNAVLVGLKGRAAVFNVQRFVQDLAAEPLQAVIPGVTLDELWTVLGTAEQALLAISGLVAVVSLASLVAVVLAGLNERRRELAVLRAVGAGPRRVLALLALEGAFVTAAGVVLGVVLAVGAVVAAGPLVQQRLGVTLVLTAPGGREAALLAAVALAGILASLVPGWRAYRLSLADGLSPRL